MIPRTCLNTTARLERDAALEEIRFLVDKWNVTEEELSDVDAEILRQRAAKRKIVLHQLRQLVEYWDITEQELRRDVKHEGPASTAGTVRYRHPLSGLTWSGEGPQPPWLKTALVKEGYRVDELRVTSSVAPSTAGGLAAEAVQAAE